MGQPELWLWPISTVPSSAIRGWRPAYLERGKTRTETWRLRTRALADFQQLMIIRANDPEFYLNRGICLMKKGQSSEAAADFERVLKLTNHSDFAEPAKKFLRQFEAQAQSVTAGDQREHPEPRPLIRRNQRPKTTSYDRIGSEAPSPADRQSRETIET